MFKYFYRRILSSLVTVFLAAVLVFVALMAIPGDPAEIILGINANPKALVALRTQLGLDKPPLLRFKNWIIDSLKGDFGESLKYRKPVKGLISDRLKVSLPLAFGSVLLACIIALPLGIFASVKKGTIWDPIVVILSQVGAAVPSFWLGLMLILIFSVKQHWLPAGGFTPFERSTLGYFKSLFLPILALGLGQTAVMTRMTRSAMLEVLSTDYIRTAKAKGLARRNILWSHALRNALVTIITILGISLTNLLIGSIVIEQVFALPGLGRLALTAMGTRDYPLLQAEVMFYASAIVFLSFVVDMSYGFLDPRIRYN